MQIRVPFNRRFVIFEAVLLTLVLLLVGMGSRLRADSGACNGFTVNLPFTDVMGNQFFCFIAQIYFQGITAGTSATTYSPNDVVTRGQMSVFLSRTHDQALKRGSLRAAFGQWWTPQSETQLGVRNIGGSLSGCASDGINVYVCNVASGDLYTVNVATGATDLAFLPGELRDVVLARSRAYAINKGGALNEVDFATDPPTTTTITNIPGADCRSIAFDGERLFITNFGGDQVTAVRINATGAPTITNYAGFDEPFDVLFDGANLWVTNQKDETVRKLNRTSGQVTVFTLPGAVNPGAMVFDGTNLWVAAENNRLYVLRTDGTLLAELTGNGLAAPAGLAFDGERILAGSDAASAPSLSVWHAASLTPLTNLSMTTKTLGVCSDGVNFFITENTAAGKLFRY